MRNVVHALLLVLFSTVVHAQQETSIRILGAYPSHISQSASAMSQHLQAIASSWTDSGLPSVSATSITLLNNGVAVPVNYPGMPGTATGTANQAWSVAAIQSLRASWQADVIILFTNHSGCGATAVDWTNGNFVQNPQGLDLRYRGTRYISVVNPFCDTWVSAHEFGHLAGGGHAAPGGGLYSDSRAYVELISIPEVSVYYWTGTAIADPSDLTQWPPTLLYILTYSRNAAGFGNASQQNARR